MLKFRKTKFLALVLALVLVAGITSGCSGGKTPTTKIPTITFMTQETPSSPVLAAQISAYQAFIAGVKDKYDITFDNSATGDALKSKLKIEMASGTLPDVFWYWGEAADSSALVDSGLLLNVKDFFAKDTLKADDFNNWDSMDSKNGNYYAIPIEYNNMVWMCNKALFAQCNLQLPKTYNDIIADAPIFKAHGIIPVATGSSAGNPGHTFLDMIYLQYPGAQTELSNITSKSQLDTPDLEKALDLVVKMRSAGCFPSDTVTNGGWGPSEALYDSGKAAMIPALNSHLSATPASVIANTVMIDNPTVDGGVVDMSKQALSCGLSSIEISKKSWNDPSKQAAIRAWVDFYLSPAMFQSRLNNEAYYPTLKSMKVDETVLATTIPLYKELLDFDAGKTPLNIMSHASYIPNATVWADYQADLDGVFAGTTTAAQYLKEIQASITANPKS